MNVNIRKLHADAVIPAYATAGAAGFDLVAVEDVIIAAGETVKVPLGLAFEIPEGYELQIRPRSGVTLKTKLRVQLGTVDADYRGEVSVIIDNTTRPEIKAITIDHEIRLLPMITQYRNTVDGGLIKHEFDFKSEGIYLIRKGDRVAQGVIAPISQAQFNVVDTLSETERGAGGFGSTGTKTEVGV